MKLEERLPDALARIADSTPINDPGAFVPDVMTLRSDLESSAPSHRVLAVAAAIVVVGVAGLVVVANRPDTNGASDAPTPPSSSIVPNTTSASAPAITGIATTVEPTLAVVGGDVVMDDVLPPGAWTGARTSAVGQSLLLFFVGATEYEPGQSCTMRYVPIVEETETEVHVMIRGEHPPAADATTACTLVGYPRSVTVELAQPFGDRTLVALGQSRGVFDGSTLAEPQWIPDGWQPSSESPGLLDPGTATSWIRSWAPPVPPPGEGSCLLGASGLALLEGSLDDVNRSTPPAEQTITGTHDINGSSATSSIQTNRNITRLAWTTGNRSYILSSSPACDGDQPPSLDIMLRFARSLGTSTDR